MSSISNVASCLLFLQIVPTAHFSLYLNILLIDTKGVVPATRALVLSLLCSRHLRQPLHDSVLLAFHLGRGEGGGDSHIYILKRTSKRYQDLVLRAWLENVLLLRGTYSEAAHYRLSYFFSAKVEDLLRLKAF